MRETNWYILCIKFKHKVLYHVYLPRFRSSSMSLFQPIIKISLDLGIHEFLIVLPLFYILWTLSQPVCTSGIYGKYSLNNSFCLRFRVFHQLFKKCVSQRKLRAYSFWLKRQVGNSDAHLIRIKTGLIFYSLSIICYFFICYYIRYKKVESGLGE